MEKVNLYLERKKFSGNEWVQTIYFNNDEHVVPFEHTIKARRYLPGRIEKPVLEGSVKYFLDFKKGKGEEKEKIRVEATLKEATAIVNRKYLFSGLPLRPYVLVEYLRQHYVPKNAEGIRLTLDRNMKYFFFPQNKNCGIAIGDEDGYFRLETKCSEPNQEFDDFIGKILSETIAFPVISKKFKAYGLLSLYRAKTAGKPFHKETKNCEIESKLELESENVFQEAKQLFREGAIGFGLPKHFPYTFESASVNRYYKGREGRFKANFKGSEAEIVRKSNNEILKDRFGLNCILKRTETKGEFVAINSGLLSSAELKGELYRMRKSFWVENLETGRFYHISLDLCLGPPGSLREIEVEYTGRYGQPRAETAREEEIVEDIARITKFLVESFPGLKPSHLTKEEWLGIRQHS